MDAKLILECVVAFMQAIDNPVLADYDRAENRLAEAQKHHPAEYQAAIGAIQWEIDWLAQGNIEESPNVQAK